MLATASHALAAVDPSSMFDSEAAALIARNTRRLYWMIQSGGMPAVHGVSSQALYRMVMALEALAEIANPIMDSSARRVVRFVAALIPMTVPDSRMADIVTQVVDHPGLPLEAVRSILAGEGRETPAHVLRDIAERLRRGQPYDHKAPNNIMKATGVSDSVVRQVSTWMGVVEAKAEVLADAAVQWVDTERPRPVREFAEKHGIGTTYAGKLLRDARKTVEMVL